MKAETKILSIELLEQNNGQVEGLPKNPREIRNKKFEQLKKSIEKDPEMISLRELLVFPVPTENRQRYVVIGGNQRLKAMKELGYTDAPCKVLPKDTPIEALKAYVIKDNGSFGDDDMEKLANEWDSIVDLDELGIDVSAWKVKEQDFDSSKELDLDDFDEEMKLTIKVGKKEITDLKERLSKVNSSPEMALLIVTGWNDGE